MNSRESVRSKFKETHSVRLEKKKITITGKDTVDFLNRIFSQKINSKDGRYFLPSAFLNANGTPKEIFYVHVFENAVELFVDKGRATSLIKQIDDFCFGEDIQIDEPMPVNVVEVRSGHEILELTQYTIEPWVVGPCILHRYWSEGLETRGTVLQENQNRWVRFSYAVPEFPREIDESNIILEGPFNEYVHRNKGCYPGQEVIERIYTYGNVAKKIINFESSSTLELLPGMVLINIAGEEVGIINACERYETGWLGLATVKRLALQKEKILYTQHNRAEINIDA